MLIFYFKSSHDLRYAFLLRSPAAFADCKVDGDLLLQMTDSQLRDDVGMATGLHRQRFLRHLDKLKTTSDYSSCDHSKIDDWLMRIGAHMTRYTYNFNRSIAKALA